MGSQVVDAYATHLPVLKAIGAHLPIERVLEFGAGKYSTLTFLDTAIYPDLTSIVTVETDGHWRRIAYEWQVDEPRLLVTPNTGDAWAVWTSVDLIFIDDGHADIQRIATIEIISKTRPSALVVIHDFEHLPYQQAADFDHCWIYDRESPCTALLWNGDRPDLEEFCRVYLA